jgi:subtilisin family serine protease
MRALLLLAAVAAAASATPLISSSLKATLSKGKTADIMVIMKGSTNSVLAAVETQNFVNTNTKATHLYQELNRFTAEKQRDVLSILSKLRTGKVTPFYITNRISVAGATEEVLAALSAREDVEEVREAKVIHLEDVVVESESEIQALEWGVAKVRAPAAWAAGFTGAGVVVSNIDTGVRHTHEALRAGYRAEYGWFDPYTGSQEPIDQNGHGSHTMGSIAGRNGTGVAQGSHWIACRGCDTSSCTEPALIGCGEWTFCPTLADGSAPNCDMRPHLSSNSWGGGNDDPFYDEVINMWNSVDILPIFAIGNSGPGCRSANSPGDRPNVISVGATNDVDAVASFSSHGPNLSVTRIKPEISGPGVNIRSCGFRGDALYAVLSGTSMATPHVAGAAALLLESGVSGRENILKALADGSYKPTMSQIVCTGAGVDPDNPWPNNSYGWGRFDIAASLNVTYF